MNESSKHSKKKKENTILELKIDTQNHDLVLFNFKSKEPKYGILDNEEHILNQFNVLKNHFQLKHNS